MIRRVGLLPDNPPFDWPKRLIGLGIRREFPYWTFGGIVAL